MEEYENRSAGRSETWGEDESRVFVEYGRAMVPGREEIERTILDLIPAEPDEKLRGQVDAALAAEEGMASERRYREADEAKYDLWVLRATGRNQMGEPRGPERPDYPVFT